MVTVRYKVFGDRVDGTYLAVDPTHAHMNMPATVMWARGLEAGPQEGTPLVHDGILYFPNPGDTIQAINAATGDIIVTLDSDGSQRPEEIALFVAALGASSSAATPSVNSATASALGTPARSSPKPSRWPPAMVAAPA